MSLKTVDIIEKYDSDVQDIVNDFYIPVLKECVNYDRISGFFTSSSLLISFRGLEGIAKNKGHIRLIVSPRLSSDDIELLETYHYNLDEYLSNSFENELDKIDTNTVDPKELLGWLLSNNILEIKIAVITKNGRISTEEEINESALFHQKVGILSDKLGNKISFSGSINETAKAWNDNNEEFKTFKSWEDGQKKYCKLDCDKFDDYWQGGHGHTKIIDFPIALKNKLIQQNIKQIDYSSKDINRMFFKKKSEEISLFFYQKEAMKKWIDSNRQMLFEMATGTGKTRTAIACIQNNIKLNKNNLVVIASPEETLSRQWEIEIENLGLIFDNVIFASSSVKWKIKMEESILQMNIGVLSNLLIITTHATASGTDFINLVNMINVSKVSTLFVGDEVHALGSSEQRKALSDKYNDRIGLSATPSRWFDDSGTKFIQNYFNNSNYVFGLDKALFTINPLTNKPFLCSYYYYFEKVVLSEQEFQEYMNISNKISKNYMFKKRLNENDDDHILEELRANIVKAAKNKIPALRNLLYKIGIENIKNTLVFTCPELIDEVCEVFKEFGIIHQKFTSKQGKSKKVIYNGVSERQFIIEQFKQENIKVLVAMKCMDEGIDIPTADRAILLSSTTNPREYIQRIGRVIRQSDNKRRAYIHDFIVSYDDPYGDAAKYVEKIEKNERNRSLYIMENALNNAEVLEELGDCLVGGVEENGY